MLCGSISATIWVFAQDAWFNPSAAKTVLPQKMPEFLIGHSDLDNADKASLRNVLLYAYASFDMILDFLDYQSQFYHWRSMVLKVYEIVCNLKNQ